MNEDNKKIENSDVSFNEFISQISDSSDSKKELNDNSYSKKEIINKINSEKRGTDQLNTSKSTMHKFNMKSIFVFAGLGCLLIIGVFIGISYGFKENNFTLNISDVLRVTQDTNKFNMKIVSSPKVYNGSKKMFDNGKYINVEVEVENLGTRTIKLNSLSFQLLDSAKKVVASNNTFYEGDRTITLGEVTPSGKERFNVFFDNASIDKDWDLKVDKEIKKVVYLKLTLNTDMKNVTNNTINNGDKEYLFKLR